jgi:hypothetical protein
MPADVMIVSRPDIYDVQGVMPGVFDTEQFPPAGPIARVCHLGKVRCRKELMVRRPGHQPTRPVKVLYTDAMSN